MNGKSRRGRSCREWMDDITEWYGRSGHDLFHLAQDRCIWNKLVRTVIVGESSFDNQTQQDTIRLIRTNELSFPSTISIYARHVISQLIRRNPSDCMPLNEVIKHEWIIRNANIKSFDENYQKFINQH
ncbi:unnamed protein product, partial [Rotaria sp. Silwood2]